MKFDRWSSKKPARTAMRKSCKRPILVSCHVFILTTILPPSVSDIPHIMLPCMDEQCRLIKLSRERVTGREFSTVEQQCIKQWTAIVNTGDEKAPRATASAGRTTTPTLLRTMSACRVPSGPWANSRCQTLPFSSSMESSLFGIPR
jgi:hypothetical protein